jgi:hypothetical protein
MKAADAEGFPLEKNPCEPAPLVVVQPDKTRATKSEETIMPCGRKIIQPNQNQV